MWGEMTEERPTSSNVDLFEMVNGCGTVFSELGKTVESSDTKNSNDRKQSGDILLHTVYLLQYNRLLQGIDDNTPEDQRKTYLDVKLPDMKHFKSIIENDISKTFNQTEIYVILRKVVAILAAHMGFQEAEAEALESLTDIIGLYIQKLCDTLKQCQNRRDFRMESAFGTSIEQTLSLAGYHDIKMLLDYYDNKIRKYNDRLSNDCVKLKQNLCQQFDKSAQIKCKDIKIEEQQ